ncbi:MAG: hypothetical protein ACREQ5_35290, partial [Candidatus Dormibacteria bacterium]
MEPLLSRWKALAPRTRVLAVGLSLALIGAIFIGMLTQRDTRIALFASPLTGDQVDEVVAQLAAWRAAFVAGSDNVRVDPRDRDALLLRLALSAVPHRHLASVDERLAKVGPLTPQSVLDAQQLDGLAGELARGLRGLAGVDDAEVI